MLDHRFSYELDAQASGYCVLRFVCNAESN